MFIEINEKIVFYRKEFDIVHVTENHNKSPVLHVEHSLGLESWCVRHVYCYTYHRLMDARQHRSRREGVILFLCKMVIVYSTSVNTKIASDVFYSKFNWYSEVISAVIKTNKKFVHYFSLVKINILQYIYVPRKHYCS